MISKGQDTLRGGARWLGPIGINMPGSMLVLSCMVCASAALQHLHGQGPTYMIESSHVVLRAVSDGSFTDVQGFLPCSLLGTGVRLLEVMLPLQHLLEILNPRSDSFLRASYEQQRRLSSTAFPSQVKIIMPLNIHETGTHEGPLCADDPNAALSVRFPMLLDADCFNVL